MFYSIKQAESLCDEEPSLIFSLIQQNHMEVVEYLISRYEYDFNIEDIEGNNVIMALLKSKQYDYVLKYLEQVDINHQNKDGDTLAHILASMDYIDVKEIMEKVFVNPNFIPNIKNKLGETILDKSMKNSYLYTTIKILENERFNSIDVYSFKHLYETYIKSNRYGAYSKLSNLEVIIDNLESKHLRPRMEKLLHLLLQNMDLIKKDLNVSKTENMDNIINNIIMDAIHE